MREDGQGELDYTDTEEVHMEVRTKRNILQIMPATGWFRVQEEDDGICAYPLVAWALVETTEIKGIVAEEPYREVVGVCSLEDGMIELCDDSDGYADQYEVQQKKYKRWGDPIPQS
jgi:hypothetical protein